MPPSGPGHLQPIVRPREDTFNCVSVEGHTAPTTPLLLLGTGHAEPVRGRDDLPPSPNGARACDVARPDDPDDGEGATHPITIDVEGCARSRGSPERSPGRRGQPPRQDGHRRGRAQLGPDRLGGGLRRRPVRGDRALPLARTASPSTSTAPRLRSTTRPSRRDSANRHVHLRLLLHPRRAVHLLDVRPHGRVRPAERGLHNLTTPRSFPASAQRYPRVSARPALPSRLARHSRVPGQHSRGSARRGQPLRHTDVALPSPPPLRTGRESFPSSSSSLHERPSRDAAASVRRSCTWICR